jgi:hypothetical protein
MRDFLLVPLDAVADSRRVSGLQGSFGIGRELSSLFLPYLTTTHGLERVNKEVVVA